MKLVITIDTEEDNWGMYRTTGHTLENIKKIPRLQELFDEFEVKPTYLVTYPVATDDESVRILKDIADSGRCEIGTHCHPWNTPPFEEETNDRNSMLCNLPAELQFKKISCLHTTIEKNLGVRPVSFRAGRWGYDSAVAHNLMRLNYAIDTSVTSYTDWSRYNGPDFSDIPPDPYVIIEERQACPVVENGNTAQAAAASLKNGLEKAPNADLAELPATVGYLQSPFILCNLINNVFTSRPWNGLKVHSVLRHMNLLNKVSLSPEISPADDMIDLTKTMIMKRYLFTNMFFHSTSLVGGLGPFVKKKEDEPIFLERIKDYLTFVRSTGIESIKLSAASFINRDAVMVNKSSYSSS